MPAFKKYSVDIVTVDGFAQSDFTFDTHSLSCAERKMAHYLENEAFRNEVVQLWERKSENDLELLKEEKGRFTPELQN